MEPRRRFRFIKELSEGAFGKVYLAEMITGDNFKSVVAIKLLHGKWTGHQEIVQRSRDEARVLGLLHHRNIIRVEDLTSIQGQCAIIMEYLDGVDLKTLVTDAKDRGERLPRKVVFEVGSQVASALDAAYNKQPLQGGEPLRLIHRDIKPSNVMLTVAGDVKVLDFGTAQARFDDREAHTQALAFGSAAYMAPERLLGDPDRPAGDVFSLGITLYELLALDGFGKIHIREEKYEAKLEKKLAELDLSDMSPDQAEQIRQAMRLLLAYDHEARPSIGEVTDLLEALADEANDGSIRRYCREVVRPICENMRPKQDPNDPLTGTTVHEDRSGFMERGEGLDDESFIAEAPIGSKVVDPGDSGAHSAGRAPAFRPPTEDGAPNSTLPLPTFRGGASVPPPPPSGIHTATPSTDASARAIPDVGDVDVRPVMPGTPLPDLFTAPTVQLGARGDIPADLLGPSTSAARPVASNGPALRPGAMAAPPVAPVSAPPVAQPPQARPAVAARPQPTPAPKKPAAAPSSGGGMGKVIGAVVGLAVLAGLGVGAVFGLGLLDGPTQAPQTNTGTPDASGQPAGRDGGRVEVAPISAERGSVILRVRPPGKSSVKISAASGSFSEEWNTSGALELVGLEAGVYKTKISPLSGTSMRATFDVQAGQICELTFDSAKGGEWVVNNCAALK